MQDKTGLNWDKIDLDKWFAAHDKEVVDKALKSQTTSISDEGKELMRVGQETIKTATENGYDNVWTWLAAAKIQLAPKPKPQSQPSNPVSRPSSAGDGVTRSASSSPR